MPTNTKSLRPDYVKKRNSYSVGIEKSGFRDYMLKEQVALAVHDCGYVKPSEVQRECIPGVIVGKDIICQIPASLNRTHIFVLAILHQIVPKDREIDSLVICKSESLANSIEKEFSRFSKYLPDIKVSIFCDGTPIRKHRQKLEANCPHIVIGTPGRLHKLVKEKKNKATQIETICAR